MSNATEAELLFPLGTVVQLKVPGSQQMVVGGAEVSIVGTSYTCFWDNNVSTFPEAVLQRAETTRARCDCESACQSYARLCDLVGCRLDAGIKPEDLAKSIRSRLVLRAEQARHLRAWRTDYFDGGSGEVTTALVNVLKLRLWGHEIKDPWLKAIERDSNICADTADLLEALVPSGE